MPLSQRQASIIFQMLCLYRRHKSLFPEVILNSAHRPPRAAGVEPGLDDAGEILRRFRKRPDAERFTALFDLLKAIDQGIEAGVQQHVMDDGILLVGEPAWPAFSLVPGEYPFARLRSIELRPHEVETFRQTPAVNFPTAGALNVATCTLGAAARTRFGGKPNLRDGQLGLVAEAVTPSAALAAALGSSLDWAREEKVDVVLFPELSIDPPGLGVVESWIAEHAAGGGVPRILVAGSFYHPVDGALRNRATIYLTDPEAAGRSFHRLHYDKHVPFSMTVPGDPARVADPQWRTLFQLAQRHGDRVIVEDFVCGGDVTLVDTSAGIFGFAICRDVLDLAGVGNPLERYLDFVDFLLVISFNSGVTTLFEAQGEDLARWHNCAVVYVNAGQAVPDPAANDLVKMGYCIHPFDGASSGIGGEIYYGKAPATSFGHLAVKTLPASGNVMYSLGTGG